MVIKYTKWPYNSTKGQILKICQQVPIKDPTKFSSNWDFWFENKPSGNPATKLQTYVLFDLEHELT
jgi:hypothetical protein